MNKNFNLLRSLNQKNEIQKTNPREYAEQVKKQSTYMLFNATRAIEAKDYVTAKQILIYIIDGCSCIQDPDKDVERTLEICFQYLAYIQQKEEIRRQRTMQNSNNMLKKRTNLIVLRYNKFSGQFQFDGYERQKNLINKDIIFYVSKINAILFGFQNIESQHSIYVMLKTYPSAFILVGILTICLVLSAFVHLIITNYGVQLPLIFTELPMIVSGCCFIIPLLMIFFKKPFEKDTFFFQQKLGQEIKKINQQCIAGGKRITFMVPQGAQLNIKVEQEQQSENQQFRQHESFSLAKRLKQLHHSPNFDF